MPHGALIALDGSPSMKPLVVFCVEKSTLHVMESSTTGGCGAASIWSELNVLGGKKSTVAKREMRSGESLAKPKMAEPTISSSIGAKKHSSFGYRMFRDMDELSELFDSQSQLVRVAFHHIDARIQTQPRPIGAT